MKKEFQAIEWLLIFVGIFLLFNKSQYFNLFNSLFLIYYLLISVGLFSFILYRYFEQKDKTNIVIFYLNKKDTTKRFFSIKIVQLFIISSLSCLFVNQIYLIGLNLVVFIILFILLQQKFTQYKIVFNYPHIYKDILFQENLEVQRIEVSKEKVELVGNEEHLEIEMNELDEMLSKRAVKYEENELLDDVLLGEEDENIKAFFLKELHQYSHKKRIPLRTLD